MRSSVFPSIAMMVVILPRIISAHSEGDVRLEGISASNLGILEIFWKGKWSTFCNLSRGGAQAACRQLGFIDSYSYGRLRSNPNLNITEVDPETPIAIQTTYCGNCSGLLHVLRCGYNTTLDAACTHLDDIILECDPQSLYAYPYETQVRLVADSSDESNLNVTEVGIVATSSGTLEIFLNNQWGNVCGDNFDKAAADSACRQMGYTSASHYSTTSKKSTGFQDLSCKGTSYDCLSKCFERYPCEPTTCSNGEVAQVTCTFDVAIAEKASSGSENICENMKGVCNGLSVRSGLSPWAIVIMIAVIVVVVLAIIGVGVAVYMGIRRWKKRGYISVN